jgi:hypothetical protein
MGRKWLETARETNDLWNLKTVLILLSWTDANST